MRRPSKLKRQVLAARQCKLGPEHAKTLEPLASLSQWVARLGQHEEAVAMARQVLEARQRVLGAEHPDTLDAMVEVSCGLGQQAEYGAAADMAV